MGKRINWAIIVFTVVTVTSSLISGSGLSLTNIFTILAVFLFAYWSVFSQKKVAFVLGSISLTVAFIARVFLPNRLEMIADVRILRPFFPSLMIDAIRFIPVVAGMTLLLTILFINRNKSLIILSLSIIALACLIEAGLPILTLSMVPLDFFQGIQSYLIGNAVKNFATLLFFVVLSIFIVMDGNLFKKKTNLGKNYLQPHSASLSLTNQLNQIKSDYDAGKITEEEYKKRRMELLTKVAK